MFLATQTRPDIAYAVGMLERHSHNFQSEHFQAAKRVLKYLLTTKDHKLVAGKETSYRQSLESVKFSGSQ